MLPGTEAGARLLGRRALRRGGRRRRRLRQGRLREGVAGGRALVVEAPQVLPWGGARATTYHSDFAAVQDSGVRRRCCVHPVREAFSHDQPRRRLQASRAPRATLSLSVLLAPV